MTMRMLLAIAAVSLTLAPNLSYATGAGAAAGFSWNQVAADESARAWAAEGWCFPGGWFSWGFPCPAPQPSLHSNRARTHRHDRKLDN